MKRTVSSGLLLVLLSQTTLAADLPQASRPDLIKPDRALPPHVTWSGAYAGLFAGYGALGSATRFICTDQAGRAGGDCPILPPRNASDGSFIGGGEIGYNWQAPFGLVAGAAADYQFTRLWGYGRRQGDFPTADGSTIPNSVANVGQRLDDLATFRGKLGFAIDRTFVYATAGLAVGNVRIDNNLSLILRDGLRLPPVASFDGRGGAVRLGYVVGAGIEHALSEHLSAKVEGLYYDLGSRAVVPGQTAGDLPGYRAGTRVTTDGFLARAGLNYRFGAGLPDLAPADSAGPATWAFEGGLRYFYSSGSPRETLNDNYRPTQVIPA
ncbi:outer membrane beta-barrel protein [Methylobacterium sp. E-005]|uniref:outer membrane protein n=1 Tax=Methylobacterium sp. E-005 TaxID=2836549 RepID=UPI001FBB9485|nr:outer membrane beta-barrel protein [Methylobacterium sp. E-005]MCJ2086031.1 outer membrane beta-barrel protein [Methylobacterium sp. E-005]